jgi:phosphate transport system protein
MRTAFHEQLEALSTGIADICGLTGQAMQDATHALLNADLALAEDVIDRHNEIAYRCTRLEADVFRVLALQAPVAGDLRAVVAALQDVADAQRMDALAVHVAKISRLRHPEAAVPDEVSGYFAEMGRIAVRLGDDTKDAVLSHDPHKAAQLSIDDQAMDNIHRQMFTIVSDHDWPHGTAAAVDVTLLSRYYERFADHAVEIARRLIYQTTGAHQT